MMLDKEAQQVAIPADVPQRGWNIPMFQKKTEGMETFFPQVNPSKTSKTGWFQTVRAAMIIIIIIIIPLTCISVE